MTAAIQINGISKRFGRVQALDQVTFEVPQHSIFGLLGPNGAGKTTLLSIVTHFLHANAGTVHVLGVNSRRMARLHGRLSTFPQDAQFQRSVPILEQLVFFRRLAGRTKHQAREQVLGSLKLVGLEEMAMQQVGSLSHGMVKRLGIAQAFLGEPEVILLDEPMAGLDPLNARQVRDLIRHLQAQATIVVSSHNLAEIQELCDHVAILDRGHLLRSDSVAAITQAGQEYNLFLSRRLDGPQLQQLAALPGVREFLAMGPEAANTGGDAEGYVVTLDLSQPGVDFDTVVAAVLRNVLEMGITPRRFVEGRSLETQFLQMTGHDQPVPQPGVVEAKVVQP
ncbi:MAG: ABC transporter ATP-binding protein [Planctomycetota bacterium]|jgi:ABC-type multidrug transport system ATPase subunit